MGTGEANACLLASQVHEEIELAILVLHLELAYDVNAFPVQTQTVTAGPEPFDGEISVVS